MTHPFFVVIAPRARKVDRLCDDVAQKYQSTPIGIWLEAVPNLGPLGDGFFAVFRDSGPDTLSRIMSVIGGEYAVIAETDGHRSRLRSDALRSPSAAKKIAQYSDVAETYNSQSIAEAAIANAIIAAPLAY